MIQHLNCSIIPNDQIVSFSFFAYKLLLASSLKRIISFSLILERDGWATGEDSVSRVCLGCICEAASGCNVTIGCDETVCGPFRITWNYWADAGKPTLSGGPNEKADGQY